MLNNNSKYPLITVIIPTYNRLDFLKRAINNVLEQTYPNKEIIVVDDCSEHDPKEVVSQFKFPVQYYRQKVNSGVAAARNRGVTVAKGVFVAFLDDDDLWATDKLEKQATMMEKYDICLCGVQFQHSEIVKIQNVSRITRGMLSYGNHFCGPSGLLIKKEVIAQEKFDEDIKFSEDWELYFRLSGEYSIGYWQEPLLFYNRSDNMSMVNEAKYLDVSSLDGRTVAIKKHRNELGELFYKRRIAAIALAFIGSKKNKIGFLRYSFQHAGLWTTISALFSKLTRNEWHSFSEKKGK